MIATKNNLVNRILRACIEAKGIKFKAIAKATKIKYDTLICYLTKGQPIPFEKVQSICDFIGVETSYIYEQYKEMMKGE